MAETEGYNGAFAGQQIDEAIGQVLNKNIPASSVKTTDGNTVEEALSDMSKTRKIRARIHFWDINGRIIDGLNINYNLGSGYWEVEFILMDNGDLYLPYDLTIYLTYPGDEIQPYSMFIEFPDGPYTFSSATGSSMRACMSIWTASGSHNTTNERLMFVYPNQEVGLGYAIGYKLIMLRGWWGRLNDV